MVRAIGWASQKSLACRKLKPWAPGRGRIVEHFSSLRISSFVGANDLKQSSGDSYELGLSKKTLLEANRNSGPLEGGG